MKHTKFFSIFVSAVLALYGLAGFYFLPLASFNGDLTRMAKLPEQQFLRTKEQPVINPDLMKSAAWQDADILAIGDSFSAAQIWQTVFAQHGVRVRTESWSSMFNICEDISDFIRSKGFKGKYVIIENAEKYHEVRLADSVKCQHMAYHPVPVHPPHIPTPLPDWNTSDYSGSMSVGFQTAWNAYRYKQLRNKPDFNTWDALDEVRMVRLENSCELFSHPRCNDVLFYKKDREQDLDKNVLDNMQIINTRLKGFSTVWVVIPDKASAYLYPDKQFWNEAEQRFQAPNILKAFQQAIRNKSVDFYLANDTHVSTTGFILLGNLLYSNIYH
jgi:hypothetical protein